MKALTVRQPWAAMILRGTDRKTIENRTWRTDHRGPLLIHSSARFRQDEYEAAYAICRRKGLKLPPSKSSCVCGKIIGVVCVSGMVPQSRSDENAWHVSGQWGWRLTRPYRFDEPIGETGNLRLWTVEDYVLDDLLADDLQRYMRGWER